MSTAFSTCDLSKTKKVSIFGRYGTGSGLAVWHKDAIPALDRALAAALKTKYGQQLRKDGIIWTYACRDITGSSSSHSEHAHPLAIDINPPTNPYVSDGTLRTDFDRFSAQDGANFVNAFISAGFSWGGDGWTGNRISAEWLRTHKNKKVRNGHVDAMHFEYDGPPQHYRVRDYFVLRWRRKPGGDTHKRTFPTFRKMLTFIRKKNREAQKWAHAGWLEKEKREGV